MARVKTKRGVVLTTQVVEELAAEAERGYDLDAATPVRVGPGRPSLGRGESPRITYRVPPELLTSAEERARAEGRTLSALARDALERYLAT